MLFNSLDFAIFLPVIFILYWFVANKNLKLQNILIVVASYVFYGWWDWRFLSLILFSTIVDFTTGNLMAKYNKPVIRRLLLITSIVINLGFLGFFKYFNFFLDNLTTAFTFFGTNISPRGLNIILPVGISFYTFQTLSYTIDVYKRKLVPTKDFFAFAAFVSFFPQLVAGPIERATHLLPQFYKRRSFHNDVATDGMRQILWGLFKKIVIADNSAYFVNQIFSDYQNLNGSTLLLGAVLFAFQIYGDFSGYSDIAIGTSRLFGFDLMRNFNFPYFSRDIAEFWRRWHISLSTWFRDYLYIPLGGSKGGTAIKIRNTFIIFLVSGFWHGANWTFIAWGAYNALLFLPLLLAKKNRQNTDTVAASKYFPSIKEITQLIGTFFLVVLGWIFFRSQSISDSLQYIKGIFNKSFFDAPEISGYTGLLFCILVLFLIEWLQRNKQHGLEISNLKFQSVRWITYLGIFLLIIFFGGKSETFIYFQF